jgi:hypothetical protein
VENLQQGEVTLGEREDQCTVMIVLAGLGQLRRPGTHGRCCVNCPVKPFKGIHPPTYTHTHTHTHTRTHTTHPCAGPGAPLPSRNVRLFGGARVAAAQVAAVALLGALVPEAAAPGCYPSQ